MRKTLSTAQGLRHRCVLAHNLLFQESGYSTVGALKDALPLKEEPLPRSPEHLFLSSYAFWGAEKVGGSRAGFERRLQRFGEDGLWKLHIRIKLVARFGAFECANVNENESHWLTIGPGPEQEELKIQLLTDPVAEPIQAQPGEARVGWFLEIGSIKTLLFSLPIAAQGLAKLKETAAKNGWGEPSSGVPVVEEYERDLLIQTFDPGKKACGLHEYYFLPPNLRHRFPKRFRQQCPQEAARYIRTTHGEVWHLYLAMQTGEERPRELHRAFIPIRQRAARSAFYFYGADRIDDGVLKKLVSDEDFFQILGLNSKGKVALDQFQPLLAQRLGALDLDDHFYEATGLTAQTTIQQARQSLAQKEPWQAKLELAVDSHRRRLGWISLITHARQGGTKVELDYTELRLVAHKLFGPSLLTRQLEEVINPTAARRIARAMAAELSDPVLRVLHLPEHRYELASFRGIGDSTIQQVCDGLEAAMLRYGDPFLVGSGFAEAQDEIDAGLDELAALFE